MKAAVGSRAGDGAVAMTVSADNDGWPRVSAGAARAADAPNAATIVNPTHRNRRKQVPSGGVICRTDSYWTDSNRMIGATMRPNDRTRQAGDRLNELGRGISPRVAEFTRDP